MVDRFFWLWTDYLTCHLHFGVRWGGGFIPSWTPPASSFSTPTFPDLFQRTHFLSWISLFRRLWTGILLASGFLSGNQTLCSRPWQILWSLFIFVIAAYENTWSHHPFFFPNDLFIHSQTHHFALPPNHIHTCWFNLTCLCNGYFYHYFFLFPGEHTGFSYLVVRDFYLHRWVEKTYIFIFLLLYCFT